MLAESQFFRASEFASHDGVPYPENWEAQWRRLVLGLCDPIRRMWGGPLIVVSGYRTPEHNRELIEQDAARGITHVVAANSHHMTGDAADLKPLISTGDPVLALHEMVLRAYQVGQLPNLGGLGLYPHWIHVDTWKAPDGHLRRWNNR